MTQQKALEFVNNSQNLPAIAQRYLLIVGISCYRDREGKRYLAQLWYKDLREHLRYLTNFTLACPCETIEPPAGTICLENDPAFANVQFVDLPATHSWKSAIATLLTTIAKLWQAIGQAEIVHTGVADWPIPKGWLVTPIVKLRRKFYIVIIESAFWRLPAGGRRSFKSRIEAFIREQLNSWCVNQADLTIFTQEEYRQSLLTKHPERGHVIHASWIDESNIISDAAARKIWHKKRSASTERIKLLFAGRLIETKGVLVLLEAMKILDKKGIPIKLDILGKGELSNECENVSQQLQGTAKINLLGTLSYVTEFFSLLQNYHAVVVPSISDEQPRIVYDAYSQAIPIIASNTAGLRDCIRDSQTGILVKPNDPVALANLIESCFLNLKQLEQMGMESLKFARNMTHQKMHQKRWQLLLDVLEQSSV